jgi:hypothetical protein
MISDSLDLGTCRYEGQNSISMAFSYVWKRGLIDSQVTERLKNYQVLSVRNSWGVAKLRSDVFKNFNLYLGRLDDKGGFVVGDPLGNLVVIGDNGLGKAQTLVPNANESWLRMISFGDQINVLVQGGSQNCFPRFAYKTYSIPNP